MNRHFILSLARSGSNYLVSCLNSHPQAATCGEVMGYHTLAYKIHETVKLGGGNYGKYLDFMYSNPAFYYATQFYYLQSQLRSGKPVNFKYRHKLQTFGLKDFAYNFERLEIPDYLVKNNISVINLYRKNIFRRFISYMKLKETGIAAVDSKTNRAKQDMSKASSSKLVLDLDETLDALKLFEKELKEQQDLAERIPKSRIFNICYEDLFSSQEAQEEIVEQLFCFLDIPALPVKGTHRKILSNRFEDVIENFEEIKDGLMHTRFAEFLDT